MKHIVFTLLLSFGWLLSGHAIAAPSSVKLDSAHINLRDEASLQRGAQTFVNYCMGCHAASFMRYSRMAKDLGLSEDMVRQNLMFVTDTIGDTMTISMRAEDAQKWFGVAPPDLSVIARSRSVDWLYTYLRTYYLDDSTIMGTNNLAYTNVAMPHVLWEQQGYKTMDTDGNLVSATQGNLSNREYDLLVRDLVNFLAYISEPSKLQRLDLGKWVLLYLFIFFLVAYPLKRAFWKDVH